MSATQQFRDARDLLLDLREDYDAAREAFVWPRPVHFNFALDWFDVVAADPARADQDALVVAEQDGSSQRLSYRELSERSSQVASWFREIGVRRGDGILVMLDNQVELWEGMLAGMKLGAVLLPTTTMLGPRDLTERVERGGVSWVLTNSENTQKFADVPGDFAVVETGRAEGPETVGTHPLHRFVEAASAPTAFEPDAPTAADETLLLYFTSGTTSRAKLVEHSHASYPIGHLSTMYWIGLEPGDVHLNVASPGWGKHAWSNFFAPWIAEATVLVFNYDRFDAGRLMEVMERESVTSFCAPPTVWRMLIQADLSRLKTPPAKLVAAGEPLNPRVISHVASEWGTEIRDGFGQTETTVQIANSPGQPLKIGSLGRPMPGFDVVLVDETSGEVLEGAGEGQVALRTDPRPVGLMTGYRNDPERNAEALRDGLYLTGDVMSRDELGVCTYSGRADDLFKASDYKISPFEVESVVIEHEAVAEVAVVPSPDETRLAVPKAYVVLREGRAADASTAESILRHCRENLPPWARVRRLEFSELPKTVSGKIRRVELRGREQLLHAEGGGGQKPTGTEYADTDFPGLRE